MLSYTKRINASGNIKKNKSTNISDKICLSRSITRMVSIGENHNLFPYTYARPPLSKTRIKQMNDVHSKGKLHRKTLRKL